jgi:UDP-N-acetylmuramoyl-tripeptide--D-alanyl-D-alanine ligase
MDLSALYKEFLLSDGISIDTRSLKQNQLFFALPGEKVNGNQFAIKAIENGARLSIVSDLDLIAQNSQCVYFEDTLNALQELAKIHRKTIHIPIIGITGSVAKTTTKELISCVLSARYNTYATFGNLNNQIGVPLSILGIPKATEIAVIEMGANHIGEIAELCNIAMPDYGLITRIGHAHLEGFGSLEGVIVAKSDLYRYIRDNGGIAFINDQDPILRALSKGFVMNKIFIHEGLESTIIKSDPELEIEVKYKGTSVCFKTHIPGLYNLENIVASISVGLFFKVELDKIANAITSYFPKANRSEWIVLGTNDILMDAYNANPTSMKEAIKSFAAYKTHKKKILLLGEMKEMGDDLNWAHNEVLEMVREYKSAWHAVCLVGHGFIEVNKGKDFIEFENVFQAKDWFDNANFEQSAILVKGSRSMTMEKIIGNTRSDSAHE